MKGRAILNFLLTRFAPATFALGAVAAPLAAQEVALQARTAIYAELLGNGGLYSLNVDRRIGAASGIRIGFATWKATDWWWSDEVTRFVIVPMQAYLLTAPAGAHHLELGGGLLAGHRKSPSSSGAFATLTATIDYRYQRPAGGFVFRAGFTPFLSMNGPDDKAYPEKGFMPSLGISFGLAF
jgi:hypothetical protein